MQKIIFKLSIISITFLLLLSIVFSFSACSLLSRKYIKTETKEANLNSFGKRKIVVNTDDCDIYIKKSPDSLISIKAEQTARVKKNELGDPLEGFNIKVDSSSDIIKIEVQNHYSRIHFFNFNFNNRERNSCTVYLPDGIDFQTENVNSHIEANDVNNNLILENTNGKIILKNTCGKLKLSLTNGNVELTADSTKGIKADLTNGKFTLYAGINFSGSFDISTVNGKITNDWKKDGLINDKRNLKGKVGISDAEIKISTTNGSIKMYSK